MGFDDSPLCDKVHPALTTVRQDAMERAEKAVTNLQKLKDGTCETMTIKLPVELVERSSVRRL